MENNFENQLESSNEFSFFELDDNGVEITDLNGNTPEEVTETLEETKDFFEETAEDNNEDFLDFEDQIENVEDENYEDSTVSSSLSLDPFMELGLIDNEDLEDIEDISELTEEDRKQLIENGIERKAYKHFEETFQELNEDKDAVALLKYVKNGGNSRDFLRNLAQQYSQFDIQVIDKDNDNHKEYTVLKYEMEVNKLSQEDALEKLEFLKEKGKLDDNFDKAYQRFLDLDEQRLAQEVQKQEELKTQTLREGMKFRQEVLKELKSTDSYGDFTFNDNDKKALEEYILKPTVEGANNQQVSGFIHDIQRILSRQDDKAKKDFLVLAKLLKTGFSVEDVKAKTKTKVIKDSKDVLEGKKVVRPYTKKGSLADFFK